MSNIKREISEAVQQLQDALEAGERWAAALASDNHLYGKDLGGRGIRKNERTIKQLEAGADAVRVALGKAVVAADRLRALVAASKED